jgi:hypothetical protein
MNRPREVRPEAASLVTVNLLPSDSRSRATGFMALYANVLRSGGLSAVLTAIVENWLRSGRLAVIVGVYANVLRSGWLSAVPIALRAFLP